MHFLWPPKQLITSSHFYSVYLILCNKVCYTNIVTLKVKLTVSVTKFVKQLHWQLFTKIIEDVRRPHLFLSLVILSSNQKYTLNFGELTYEATNIERSKTSERAWQLFVIVQH